MGANLAIEIIHCVRIAGQDRARVDLGPSAPKRVEEHNTGIRRRAVARQLEPKRQRAGGQRRR